LRDNGGFCGWNPQGRDGAYNMKQIEVVAAIIRKGDKIFATQRGYGEWKNWSHSLNEDG
jgi:hypothetical protein